MTTIPKTLRNKKIAQSQVQTRFNVHLTCKGIPLFGMYGVFRSTIVMQSTIVNRNIKNKKLALNS